MRPSTDWLSNNVFRRFKQIGNIYILKKVAERSRDSCGRRSRDHRPTVKQRLYTFQAIWKIFEKSHSTDRTISGRSSRARRPTVKRGAYTFQAIWIFFEKSHGTVTRPWSEFTQPSADCQTTAFRRFKQLGKNLKKVTQRSHDSGRSSRDRRPTVKQRFLGVSNLLKKVTERSRYRGQRSRDRRSTFLYFTFWQSCYLTVQTLSL